MLHDIVCKFMIWDLLWANMWEKINTIAICGIIIYGNTGDTERSAAFVHAMDAPVEKNPFELGVRENMGLLERTAEKSCGVGRRGADRAQRTCLRRAGRASPNMVF